METTQNPPAPPAPAAAAPAASLELKAKIVYVLYLLTFLTGITPVIGVIVAYVYQGDAQSWLQTHYRFQIRTFWLGILYALVAGILTAVLLGIIAWAFLAVWLIVRCVKGFRALERREAIANVETWWW